MSLSLIRPEVTAPPAYPAARSAVTNKRPLPEGRALVVPLLNPAELVAGVAAARFGTPLQLDLGGLGIRSIKYWERRRTYMIIAGHFGADETGEADDVPSVLHRWSGDAAPVRVEGVDLSDLNPESQVIYPRQESSFQIISDDGNADVGGAKCKDVKEAGKKRFRSRWLSLPPFE